MNEKTPPPKASPSGTGGNGNGNGRPIEAILSEAIVLLMPTSSAETKHGFLKAAISRIDKHGINAAEVEWVIGGIIADGVRPQSIVPEILKRVQAKRSARHAPVSRTASREWAIDQEAQRRRGQAHTKAEIEEAFEWEQQARYDAGLPTFTPFVSARRGFSVEALHKLSKHPVYYRMAKDLGWATPELFAQVDALNARGVAPPDRPVLAPLPDPQRANGLLTREELARMPAETASLGIKYGYLRRVDGRLEEVIQ